MTNYLICISVIIHLYLTVCSNAIVLSVFISVLATTVSKYKDIYIRIGMSE